MQKNENRLGYKKTKVGWVPREWDVQPYGTAFSIIMDGTHFSPQSTSGPMRYITSRNIRGGMLDLTDCFYISESEHEEIYRKCPVRIGEILLTKDGANAGNACLNPLDEKFSLLSSVAVLDADTRVLCNQYAIQWILSSRGQDGLLSTVAGQAITRITLVAIAGVSITLPPLPEQKAIAEVLEAWDKAIQGYEKKIEKKRSIKKGLMQRLLSGEQRLQGFDEEWDVVAFGSVFTFLKTYALSREQLTTDPTEGTQIHNIHYGDLHATYEDNILNCATEIRIPRVCQSSDLPSDAVTLQEGDLAIADASEDYEGVCACIELQNVGSRTITGGLHTIAARDTSGKTVLGYRSYILQEEGVSKELRQIATGVSVHGVSKTNLAKVQISLPPLSEQQAIASVLSAADAEIAALERKLASLKEQKRFLLNNLVTGTIRLPEFSGSSVG
jgi:type I restriction enzyme S subunit